MAEARGEDHRRDRKSEEGRAQGQPLTLCVVIILDRSYPPLPTNYQVPYVSVDMRFNQC